MVQKYYLGFLLLVILSSSLYVLLPDSVRIDVEKTKTTFKVFENDSWILSGTERTILYDGTTKMRASSRELEYSIEDNITTIVRTSNFKDEIVVIDIYTFNGSTTNIEMYPINHEVRIINGLGKIFVYEVKDLVYDGATIKDILSPQSFGHNMKVEWEDGNYYSKIYKYKYQNIGKLTIKYRIDSNNFVKNVRLFDPPSRLYDASLTIGISDIDPGEFTTLNFSEMYVTNAVFTGTIELETDGNARVLSTCSGLFIRILNITFDGGMANDCIDNLDGTYDCTSLDQINPAGNAIYTVEGCTSGVDIYQQENSYTGQVSGELTVNGVNTPPQWFDNSTNYTKAGEAIEHRVRWTDDTNLSGYIFSFDNGTGTFTNDTFVSMTESANWSNVTKVVNSTVGSTIQWIVYVNDSDNAWNITDTFTYDTTDGDTCTYISGDWTIECSDFCIISTVVDLNGNNVYINGTGVVTLNANIVNYGETYITGTSSSNICEVYCLGGCFYD